MKNKRQREILALLSEYPIDTQEELTAQLQRKGFSCTQATVSRDIKELKLVKVTDERGGYRYAKRPEAEKRQGVKYSSILEETVISARYAGNMVVVKTFVGHGDGRRAPPSTRGNGMDPRRIAGDDTIFLVMETEEFARAIGERIGRIIERKG